VTIYTSAVWIVKPGKEAEFVKSWENFANWTAMNQAGAGSAKLIQGIENPSHFISFGPWENIKSISAWRAMPEFAAFFAQAKLLCDDIQPGTFNIAAEVGI
jgi:quinol monooxygenase YgiN